MSTHRDIRVTSKLYYYAAYVTEVYDGDTITVNLDLGMGIWRNGLTIRLWKIDTPEVKGASREEGLRVRDMVRDLVLNQSILLRTILDKRGEDQVGKYGRLLGEVLVPNARGALINVNDLLLGLGLAVSMGPDGSRTRSLESAAASGTTSLIIPATIPCPFCGQSRNVIVPPAAVEAIVSEIEPTQTTEMTILVNKGDLSNNGDLSNSGDELLMEQCPNCLDEARKL